MIQDLGGPEAVGLRSAEFHKGEVCSKNALPEADLLLWSKDPDLDKAPLRFRRFVAEKTAVGPRELGEFSPPLYDLPAFDGPGSVSMVSGRQWWADWTRGEHESTLDVSVRLLPSTSGMESVRQDHFERLRSSLPAHASGDVLDGETNRERPVTRLHMHFQINCDDGCYRVHDSSFDVPISGIQKLEQPEPGVNFAQPE